ncbi:hypothetical protein HK096_001146, partial [Nowakowskiella sp. JEL0078]
MAFQALPVLVARGVLEYLEPQDLLSLFAANHHCSELVIDFLPNLVRQHALNISIFVPLGVAGNTDYNRNKFSVLCSRLILSPSSFSPGLGLIFVPKSSDIVHLEYLQLTDFKQYVSLPVQRTSYSPLFDVPKVIPFSCASHKSFMFGVSVLSDFISLPSLRFLTLGSISRSSQYRAYNNGLSVSVEIHASAASTSLWAHFKEVSMNTIELLFAMINKKQNISNRTDNPHSGTISNPESVTFLASQ